MKYISLALFFILLFSMVTKSQENYSKRVVDNLVKTNFLPVIISQPNCPLQIEKINVKANDSRSFTTFYQIRHIGNKAIKSYSLARWSSDNTGVVSSGIMPESEELKPGQETGNYLLQAQNQDATSLQNLDKGNFQINRIAFFMIVEIVFADGSRYDANESFNALENHLRNFETIYQKYDDSKKN